MVSFAVSDARNRSAAPLAVAIFGEASASSAPLTAEASDLSARVPTSAAVLWKPGPSEGRDVLQTSDIAVVVQV